MTQQPEEKHVTKVIVLLDTLMRLSLPNGPPLLMSVEKPKSCAQAGARGTGVLACFPTAWSPIDFENLSTQRTQRSTEKFTVALCLCVPLWFRPLTRSLEQLRVPKGHLSQELSVLSLFLQFMRECPTI